MCHNPDPPRTDKISRLPIIRAKALSWRLSPNTKASVTIPAIITYMSESTNSESFEEIVQWAYSTLPQRIRDLPDFPGIQVVDEPPKEVLRDVAKRKSWPKGTEMLGLFSGIRRTERHYLQTRTAPDLIFVFRGPVLRCAKGDLRAEVKRVVWHEVAHWLGHDEEEVSELGLSSSSDVENRIRELGKRESPVQAHNDAVDSVEDGNEEPHCIECYSADVTCRKFEKSLSCAGANPLVDPITVAAKGYRCNSCGYEWNDEDTARAERHASP
jgi:predicted Zn-dependent protease with MMP-like domain